MKKLSIDGVSLNFIEENIEQDCAILFLHGNSHSLKTFSKQMNSPALKNYRLIFVDLPGHGSSSALKNYSVKILSQIFAKFLKSLEIKNYIIAGHSLGGHIAINMIQNENGPRGLFLFGTPPLKNPFDVTAFLSNSNASALGKNVADCVEISTLMDQMNYVGTTKESAIVDFLNTDSIFRTSILVDVASGNNADEVELIKSFNGSVIFLLATNDSLINNNYITQEFDTDFNQVVFEEIESGHSPHVEMDVDFNKVLSEFSEKVFEERELVFVDRNGHQHKRSQNEQRN